MNFADNLKKIMKNKKMTALNIAETLGVSRGTITHWSNGVRSPDPQQINQLSQVLDVPVSDLFGDTSRIRTIPLIGLASCGKPENYALDGYEQIPISEELYKEGMYAVRAEGDSMSPKINNNAIVYCRYDAAIDNGHIVHYSLNGESGIKKYKINEKGDIISLIPINSSFDIITVHIDDVADLNMARVVGVVDMDF